MGILGPLGPRPLLMADNIESAGCVLREYVLSVSYEMCMLSMPDLPTYVRQDSRCGTSGDTTPQINSQLLQPAQVRLVLLAHTLQSELVTKLVDGELTDGIGDLLAEKREEPRVQPGDTFLGRQLGKSSSESVGVLKHQQAVISCKIASSEDP
jgi:hypothetical protein